MTTFRSTFRSVPIGSDRFDPKPSDQISDRFRSLPIKENLGLIGNDQSSRARADIEYYITTQLKEQKEGFNFVFRDPLLKIPSPSSTRP